MDGTSYMNEIKYLEAKRAKQDPRLAKGNQRIKSIYDKNESKTISNAEETLATLKASVESSDDARTIQTNMRNTYAYQNMILSNLVKNNNLTAAQINTLRRKYQILKYEEEKNQDRNLIMTNLVIVLLLLIILTVLYKKLIISYDILVLSYLVSAILTGFYLVYQYYYDYYIRDKIFYNQIYKQIEDDESKKPVCPANDTTTTILPQTGDMELEVEIQNN
jgi:hypothetical protein